MQHNTHIFILPKIAFPHALSASTPFFFFFHVYQLSLQMSDTKDGYLKICLHPPLFQLFQRWCKVKLTQKKSLYLQPPFYNMIIKRFVEQDTINLYHGMFWKLKDWNKHLKKVPLKEISTKKEKRIRLKIQFKVGRLRNEKWYLQDLVWQQQKLHWNSPRLVTQFLYFKSIFLQFLNHLKRVMILQKKNSPQTLIQSTSKSISKHNLCVMKF